MGCKESRTKKMQKNWRECWLKLIGGEKDMERGLRRRSMYSYTLQGMGRRRRTRTSQYRTQRSSHQKKHDIWELSSTKGSASGSTFNTPPTKEPNSRSQFRGLQKALGGQPTYKLEPYSMQSSPRGWTMRPLCGTGQRSTSDHRPAYPNWRRHNEQQ